MIRKPKAGAKSRQKKRAKAWLTGRPTGGVVAYRIVSGEKVLAAEEQKTVTGRSWSAAAERRRIVNPMLSRFFNLVARLRAQGWHVEIEDELGF